MNNIETFNKFIIIKNEDLLNNYTHFGKKWNEEIKKINPLFQINSLYPLNKTIIYNYGSSDTFIFSLDICVNIISIIVPIKCVNFYENILPDVILYLTNHIKSICGLNVANEIKYKLYIYIHQNHPQFQTLFNHPLILFENAYYKKSVLNRDLGDNYTAGIVYLYFDDLWNIKEYISKNNSNVNNNNMTYS